MNPHIKKILRRVLNYCSMAAVRQAVREDPTYQKIWDMSLKVLPDLSDHYATVKVDAEAQVRLRLLLCAQAIFISRAVDALQGQGQTVGSWVDVGDSDGAARQLFLKSDPRGSAIRTLGVNLEKEAVELIRSRGLEAECMDAMDLHKKGMACDLVSVFESLEHLPNPIGFLESIHPVVKKRLIISVPLIVTSRVGLRYLTPKWESHKKPSYSNNHVFELSPVDWTKLFQHTGWAVENAWYVRQYPRRGLLKWAMETVWRKLGFEGYWFVLLRKDETCSSRFSRW